MSRYAFRDDYEYDDEEEEEKEETVSTRKTLIARAPRSEAGRMRRARNGIRVGDKIEVISGFSYIVDGPRNGYFYGETLVKRGPAWSALEIEHCELEQRARNSWKGSIFSRKTELLADVREFEARTGETVAWPNRESIEESLILETELARLREQDKAEWALVTSASEGEAVSFRGRQYTKGGRYTHTVYHSDAEDYGDLCDATCYSAYNLIPVEGEGSPLRIVSGRMPYRR